MSRRSLPKTEWLSNTDISTILSQRNTSTHLSEIDSHHKRKTKHGQKNTGTASEIKKKITVPET